MTALLPVVARLAILAAAAVQVRAPASGTGIIAGRVVDAQSGAPIADVNVHARQVNPPLAVGGRSESTITDGDGRFVFRTLPAGRFEVSASAIGYLEGAAGKRRVGGWEVWLPVTEDERIENVTIELWRAAHLSGHVMNEVGEPLRDALVYALRIGSPPDPRGPSGPLKTARTDAAGAYQMWALAPGEYMVTLPIERWTVRVGERLVSSCGPPPPPPPAGAPPIPVVPPAPAIVRGAVEVRFARWLWSAGFESSGTRTYTTLFHPNQSDPALGQPIRLAAGDSRSGVDFRLQAVASADVRGRLVRTGGRTIGDGTTVKLRRIGAGPHAVRGQVADAVALLDPDGTFTFLGVPVGRYELEATLAIFPGSCDVAPGRDGRDVPTRVVIEVPAEGIDDLVVPIAEGLTVRGAFAFRGTGPQPAVIDLGVHAIPASPRFNVAWGNTNGRRFTIAGLAPGSWALGVHENVSDNGWFIESIALGDRDLTAEPLNVETSDLQGLVISLTNRPASAEGAVLDASGRPVHDATVVAFPTNRAFWARAHPSLRRFAMTRALGGKYRFESLIPGDYFLTAVDERRMDAWPEAAFLESLQSAAARIRVEPGSTLAVPVVRE